VNNLGFEWGRVNVALNDAGPVTEMEMNRQFISALTADALKGTRERLLESGFDGYLSKPLRLKQLAEALEKIAG